MFHHVKELQFNARVSEPDARFARLLLEQFGGPNGELKAAMQYFVQAFGCRKAKMDKATLPGNGDGVMSWSSYKDGAKA